MMTKKDYEVLAQVFATERRAIEKTFRVGYYDPDQGIKPALVLGCIRLLAERMGEALEADNPRFDWGKWRVAVHGVET